MWRGLTRRSSTMIADRPRGPGAGESPARATASAPAPTSTAASDRAAPTAPAAARTHRCRESSARESGAALHEPRRCRRSRGQRRGRRRRDATSRSAATSMVASRRAPAYSAHLRAARPRVLDSGGSWLLPRRIGLHQAKELALLADVIDATEAERLGSSSNRVVAHDLGRRRTRRRRSGSARSSQGTRCNFQSTHLHRPRVARDLRRRRGRGRRAGREHRSTSPGSVEHSARRPAITGDR